MALPLRAFWEGWGCSWPRHADLAQRVRFAGVLPVLAALVGKIIRSLARGDVGLDIVAALSMPAA